MPPHPRAVAETCRVAGGLCKAARRLRSCATAARWCNRCEVIYTCEAVRLSHEVGSERLCAQLLRGRANAKACNDEACYAMLRFAMPRSATMRFAT